MTARRRTRTPPKEATVTIESPQVATVVYEESDDVGGQMLTFTFDPDEFEEYPYRIEAACGEDMSFNAAQVRILRDFLDTAIEKVVKPTEK